MQLHGSELKKGVVIERGASPWQIFQQNEQGFAVIRLSGTAHRVRQSFELPLEFSAVPEGSITVKARIALESSGESVCPSAGQTRPAAGRSRLTASRRADCTVWRPIWNIRAGTVCPQRGAI